MSSKLHPTWKLCISYTVLAVFAIFALGLVSTSYAAIFSVLIGVVLAWPTRLAFISLIKIFHKYRKHLYLSIMTMMISLSLLILLLRILSFSGSQLMSAHSPAIEEYRVTVSLVDSQIFSIQENIRPILSETNEEWFELPNKEISSKRVGLLLGEVKILPLGMDSTGDINLTLPDGNTINQSLCGDYCPKVIVEIIDFPNGSFYQAKYSKDINRETYLGTETITWSSQSPDRGLFFAYILPPFHQFRAFLNPFLNISSISQWILALLTLFSTVVITPVARPVLTKIAKERLSSFLKKRPKKKLKIFISSKGEEKEIDIDE